MDTKRGFILVVALLVTPTAGKILRYQIITKDDGSKEILNQEPGTPPSQDLEFLARDLNLSLENVGDQITQDESQEPVSSTPAVNEIKETPKELLNKWNSYTANGWTGQENQIYTNSTKLLIFDDGSKPNFHHNLQLKKGRAENFTEENNSIDVSIVETGLWEVFERLYDCFNDFSKHGSSFKCLKYRLTSFFFKYIDQSTSGKSSEEKTLIHGKKVLKGALLPLLVLLIIKYLVALPVIAAGLITIKTFWLSLLSAGVAAFGAPWKQSHVIKRYRPDTEQAWSHHAPAWTAALHPPQEVFAKMDGATEKYFM